MSRTRFALAGTALVLVFLLQAVLVVHREAVTNAEGYQTYAGYRYWQCGDFGVNPDHPPPAKMLAPCRCVAAAPPRPQGPCPPASTAKLDGYAASAAGLNGDGATTSSRSLPYGKLNRV